MTYKEMNDSDEPMRKVRAAVTRRKSEADLELDNWLNDTMTRRDLFERKMDARTSRDSLIKRGAEWIGL